jgi:hypothetical protein
MSIVAAIGIVDPKLPVPFTCPISTSPLLHTSTLVRSRSSFLKHIQFRTSSFVKCDSERSINGQEELSLFL